MRMRSSAPDGRSREQHDSAAARPRHWLLPPKPRKPVSPALLKHAESRAQSTQNRVSDWITRFAGSMAFVYVHVIWFSCWIGLAVEAYPFPLLTMIVSLEAIFLSTFVLISQNRSDAKRQVIADQEWTMVQEEQHQNSDLLNLSKHQDEQNSSLIDLSNQILALTKEVRGFAHIAREDMQHGGEKRLDLLQRQAAVTETPPNLFTDSKEGDHDEGGEKRRGTSSDGVGTTKGE